MLRVSISKHHFLGPGKVRLLELIEATGSISAAARMMEMSYRRAWLLVDSLNAGFRKPVVTAAVGGKQGGGATLSPLGLEIIARYRRMEAKTGAAIAADVLALRSLARSRTRDRIAPPSASRTTRSKLNRSRSAPR